MEDPDQRDITLWYKFIIFARSGAQCFMPALIVQQATKYTQDIQYNIPKDWVVYNTSSGYMDRDGWMKAMIYFKNLCGENKINPQVLFYDVHYIHF